LSEIFAVAVVFAPYSPATRSPKYLKFVRSMACIVCGSWKNVEAAHTGPHALSDKAPDRDALPLCARCHRTDTYSLSNQGPVIFAEMFHLDVAAQVERLNKLYDERIVRRRK
jgi:cytochrome c553